MKRLLLLPALALFGAGCQATTVDPGHVGAATDWGEVQPWTFAEGFHFHTIGVDVYECSVQTQALDFSGDSRITVLSKDRLQMSVDVTVQYSLHEGDTVPQMFRRFFTGETEHYTDRVVVPAARESIRDIVSQMDAMDAVRHRDQLGPKIRRLLKRKVREILVESGVKPYGIRIIGVQLRNIELPGELRQSIARIQQRQNEALERQQQIEIARQEAERARIEAEGAAAVARIEAQREADVARLRAQGQADANHLVSASITPNLLRQQEIEAQKELARHVQTVVLGGENASTVIPLPGTGGSR